MQIEIVERVQSKASESGGSVLRFPGKAGGEIIERFFDISPVPLCVIDGALRFRMVNEAAASIIGLPAASLTGHPVTNIIPKTKTLLEECFRCVRNGEPLADQQLAWQGRHYQLIFGVLRDQSFIGLSIAVIDVTQIGRATRLNSSH